MPDLPTIPDSIYAAAIHAYSHEYPRIGSHRARMEAALNAVWPDLHALAVASLPAAVPAPGVLPDRGAIARTIWEASRQPEGTISATNRAADAVLSLLAETITPWKRVEPDTVIKAGTLHRIEWDPIGDAVTSIERTNTYDITIPTDPCRFYIDPRTVPADPDADLVGIIAAALSDTLDGEMTCDWTAEARDMLAAIRETHTIEPKPATGPLGGAR